MKTKKALAAIDRIGAVLDRYLRDEGERPEGVTAHEVMAMEATLVVFRGLLKYGDHKDPENFVSYLMGFHAVCVEMYEELERGQEEDGAEAGDEDAEEGQASDD